ncbi:50S ribosomal protein L24 [Candidatus Woesearchaeota archaeon]|nr:50S ribosomal protein L24 [Candidatus Woesearchaeota archaeon]
MKSIFSLSWIKSKQPRKQRKFRANAPTHIRRKFMGSNLSKDLRSKYNLRTVPVVKGDKVKIMKGQFKGQEGSIDKVDVLRTKVYVSCAQVTKKEGSKAYYPINPSNLMIVELNLKDSKRIKQSKEQVKGAKDGKKSQ